MCLNFSKMFKNLVSKILILLFVVISTTVNLGQCQINCNSCADILATFEAGRDIYKDEDAYNQLLAARGYVLEENDLGFILFYVPPTDNKYSAIYDGANQALAGIANIYDKCITNNDATKGWTKYQIRQFFRSITHCIPIEQRANTNPPLTCDKTYPYRFVNGSCNNLTYPHTGEAYTSFERKIPAVYEDNVSKVRESIWTGPLPNPRGIVLDVLLNHKDSLTYSQMPNVLWLFFGQFITHDVAFAKNIQPKLDKPNAIRCCTANFKTDLAPSLQNSQACLPLDVPRNDAYYRSQNIGCLTYVRSERAFAPTGTLEAADQLNRATGYIDLSDLYGSTDGALATIRAGVGGRLQTNNANILPLRDTLIGEEIFKTADDRGNQTPQLCAITALYNRFHNYVANELAKMYPGWGDEKLFQEARRIIIALHQNIIYSEYLPTIIGTTLLPALKGEFTTYKTNTKGTTLNEFTTAPFRVFHVNTPTFLQQAAVGGQITGYMTLSASLLNTTILKTLTGFRQIVNGMLRQPIKLNGISTEVINKMFADSDLISVDIMRGRDHGLPTYVATRKYCNLPPVKSWTDLLKVMAAPDVEKLKRIYSSYQDIDLYVGLVLEYKYGQVAGPTTKCLIADQFKAFKDGDRFFFTHQDSPSPFTKAQLVEIRSFSMAKLICMFGDRIAAQPRAFYIVYGTNQRIDCSQIGRLNMQLWKPT